MDDPGPSNLTVPIIILVLIVLYEEFIYLLKAALTALPDSRAERLMTHNSKSVRRIIGNKDDVFSATSFASILMTLLFSFIAAYSFGCPLAASFIEDCGLSRSWAVVLTAAIICLASALILMALTGILPRQIGRRKPVGVITKVAVAASIFYSFNLPFVKICKGISTLFMKLTGLDRMKQEDSVTEAEILSVVEAGGDAGTIEDEQREMINNIFEFDDVAVSDLMTHRTDAVAIEASEGIDKLRDLAVEEGYSRIPVYKEDIDNIVGIAYIKDLLKYVDGVVPARMTVESVMRDAFYVPESMPCDKLFKQMNEKHVQMAIAVDEYGGTAGIITLEDLLESIVGNIQDEYDNEEDEEISKVTDTTFKMDGTTDIEEVGDQLDVEFPEGDYDTIGGFVISQLDYIPQDGSEAEIEFGGYRFRAKEIEDRRIGEVVAEKVTSDNISS